MELSLTKKNFLVSMLTRYVQNKFANFPGMFSIAPLVNDDIPIIDLNLDYIGFILYTILIIIS